MNRRDSQIFKDLYTKYNQSTLINELTKIREEEWSRLREEEWARQSINVTVDGVLTAPNTPCSTKSLRVQRSTKAGYSILNDSFTKSISIEKISNSVSKRKKSDVHEKDKPLNEVDFPAIREEEPAIKPNKIIATRSKSKVEVECPEDKVHQISSSTKRKSLCRRNSRIEPQIQNAEEISKPIKARKRSINESENVNKIYYSVSKEPPIELPDFKRRYIINTERSSNNSYDFESIDRDVRNCYDVSARQTRSEPRKRHLKLNKDNLSKPKKSKRNTISTLSRNREALGSTNRKNAVKRRNKTESQDVEEKRPNVIEKRTAPLLDAATIKEIKVYAPENEIQDPLQSDNVSHEANDNRSNPPMKISSDIDAVRVNDPHNKTSVSEPTTNDIGESANIIGASKQVTKKTRSCHRASHTKSTRRTRAKPRSKTKAFCNKIGTLGLEVDINSNPAVENTTQIESGTNVEKASVDEIKESFQDTNKDEFKSLEGSPSTDRNASNDSKIDSKTYTEKAYLDKETYETIESASNEKNSHNGNQAKPSVDQWFENHNDSNETSINSNPLMIPEEKVQQNDKISPYKPRNALKHNNDDLGKMFHVDELLRNVGVLRTSKVSLCVKAAIFNGHIDVNENMLDLKAVILEIVDENYCPCRQTFTATLENLMYQPDHGGYDREELNLATVKCSCASGCFNKDCDVNSLFPSPHAIYVTNICKGSPTVTTGHYHNHCDECPNFGMCIGDYRESHCLSCHEHFFKNGIEGLCTNCNQ